MQHNTDERKQRHKIVVMGEQGGGKTSILCRFLYNNFDENYMGTIGIDFLSQHISVGGKTRNLQIWDTAGQERFRSLVPTYCRNARGVLLVYDVTRENALITIREWHRIADTEASAPVFVLVANKIDDTANRVVDTAEGKKLAAAIGAMYVETSAKTGHNVVLAFKTLVGCIIRRDETREDAPGEFVNVVLDDTPDEDDTPRMCLCLL